MKFQQILPLQKYIDSSFAGKKLPRSYLVVHPQREERRNLLEKISQKLASLTQAEVSFLEGDFGQIYQTLATPSLFGSQEVVIWDDFKKLTEEVQQKIVSYILKPSPFSFFLIGMESSKAFPSLYTQVDKELVFLDVSDEKPWEKEKRVQQEVLLSLKEQGKTITPSALSILLSGTACDSLHLESEIAKTMAYVGERVSITEKDVLAIGSFAPLQNAWLQAEKVLWEEGASFDQVDTSFFLGFLGQVRFLAQQARQVAWLIKDKKEMDEIAKSTNIRTTQLPKVIQRVKSYKINYLDEALELVYNLEIMAKNSNLAALFLLDVLMIKLKKLRKLHAN